MSFPQDIPAIHAYSCAKTFSFGEFEAQAGGRELEAELRRKYTADLRAELHQELRGRQRFTEAEVENRRAVWRRCDTARDLVLQTSFSTLGSRRMSTTPDPEWVLRVLW